MDQHPVSDQVAATRAYLRKIRDRYADAHERCERVRGGIVMLCILISTIRQTCKDGHTGSQTDMVAGGNAERDRHTPSLGV